MIVFNILMALLLNAVPAYGIGKLGWSVPTVLVLYWLENLLTALFTTLRIVLHRHWTRKRGHWRAQSDIKFEVNGKPVAAKTFLSGYAGFAFIFTLAHGVFVAGICALLAQQFPDQAQWHVSAVQLKQGGLWMGTFLALDLLADLSRLRHGTFAWLKQSVERRMGRVLILHLAIIFGMFVMFITQSPFSVVFVLIALKTLADVASAISGNGSDATASTRQWQDKLAGDRQQAIDDEQVMPETPGSAK